MKEGCKRLDDIDELRFLILALLVLVHLAESLEELGCPREVLVGAHRTLVKVYPGVVHYLHQFHNFVG